MGGQYTTWRNNHNIMQTKKDIYKCNKIYREKHREQIKKWQDEWKKNNPEKVKEYYSKHKVKRKIDRQKNLDHWRKFFKKDLHCEICNRKLFFSTRTRKTSVCFDHRGGGREAIKRKPASWLADNKRTKKTEDIWESCNFGVLCSRCNQFLPTKNRIEFLEKALEYAKMGGK